MHSFLKDRDRETLVEHYLKKSNLNTDRHDLAYSCFELGVTISFKLSVNIRFKLGMTLTFCRIVAEGLLL